MDEKEAGEAMLLETDMLLAEISILSELKLWEVSACMRVADIVNGLRQLIKARITNKK